MARTVRRYWAWDNSGTHLLTEGRDAKPRHCGCCCSEVSRQGRRKARRDAKAALRLDPEHA